MQVSIHNGLKYVTATSRGVEYCLSRNGDAWFVRSHRLALGRFNTGGGKHYATLEAVAAGCKAFADLAALQAAMFGLSSSVDIGAAA